MDVLDVELHQLVGAASASVSVLIICEAPRYVHRPHMRRFVYARDNFPDTSARFRVPNLLLRVPEPQVHSADVYIHYRL